MAKKKRRHINKILATVLAAAILLPTAVKASSVSDLQKDIKENKEKLEDVEEEIDELNEQKSAAETAIGELDTQLNEISEELDSLNEQIDAKEAEIEENLVRLDEAREEENEQYENMKLRIRYMYENSQESVLQILLESESLADFVNRAQFSNEVLEYDREKLDDFTAIKEEIAELEEKLEEEREELKEMQAEVEAEMEEVEDLLSEKQQLLSSVNSNIESAMSEQEQIEAEIKEDEEKLSEAQKAQSSGSYVYSGSHSGKFTWPCPSSTRITSKFGKRTSPTAGASSYHRGIDIGAAYGSSIVAAADGVVTSTKYTSAGGNEVMISHGNGLFTVYKHCSKFCVSAGTTVSAGDVVAKVGSTGISTGAHLHFSVIVNGTYVNPLNYL